MNQFHPEQTHDLASVSRELDNIRNALDRSAIVAVTDKAGTIIYVNDKFCEISRFSREELLGQNHRVVNSGTHPKEFFIEMWKQIASGKVWEGEIKNRAKDGTFYWVHTTIVPFLDARGRPERYVSIRYEMTQKKLAEEQLASYAKKLEQSNKELESFASVAAHDLQEPLRKIQAFSDRLIAKEAPNLSEQGKVYLDKIQDAAGRMRSLITELLSFSRVTTKAQPFLRTDLNEVLRTVLSDLEVKIEQSHADVKVSDLPSVEADRTQLVQLFTNILGNALKFHKKGIPPVVRVEAQETKLLSGGQQGTRIHQACKISISDNGIGFDEKYLDKIFNIFQRLHGRQEYEGTGIGLAICRKIVERHHGIITARSQENEGATFEVTLPLEQTFGDDFR